MTGRETALIVVLAGVLILAAAVAGWLLRPARGRHEQREAAADAEADTFITELRGLPAMAAMHSRPAPGLDIYTDHTVHLRQTPPPPGRTLWQPPWPPAALHEPAAERKASDTDVRAVTCAAPARPASMQAEPDQATCHCGRPAGHIEQLRDASPADIADAFDTAQFEAVKIDG